MSNKQNIGYDDIKKMLNRLRTISENTQSSKTLNEEKVNTLVIGNNVEIKVHSDDDLDLKISDEEKNALNQLIENFKSQVFELTTFDEGFNIYTNSVRLDGNISEDLSFVLIAGEDAGLYVNCNMLKIESENATIIEKLYKFEHTFQDVANDLILSRKNN
jgi:virulence-associated protein VapD